MALALQLILAIALVMPLNSSVHAQEPAQLAELRALFVSAERNLKAGKLTVYRQQKAQLQSYPLIAYLDYQEMARGGNKPKDIEAFLDSYPNFPAKSSLRKTLLNNHYKNGRWSKITAMNPEKDDICLHLLSLHKTKQEKGYVLSKIKELWLDGHYFNEKCNDLLISLKLRLHDNNDILWDRINAAAINKNWRSIQATAKYIPQSQKSAYTAMANFKKSIRGNLKKELAKMKDSEPNRVALAYGLSKYPSSHILEAYKIYAGQIAGKFSFDAEQQSRIEYHLGLFLTIADEPQGFDMMLGLNPAYLDDTEHEWRVRSAITFGKWKELVAFVDDFPPALQQKSDWLYWKGYALIKLGRNKEARQAFQLASEDRSFYGFLAAESIGQPIQIKQKYTDYKGGDSVLAQPSFQRFFELHALGRIRQGLREWEATIRNANKEEQLYLASAAYAKSWHFHSIRAFAVAKYWDDLHRRFPTPYLEQVKTAAKSNRLDPALLYAIMRTESSFRPDIVSRAGAVGLMQILPSTGKVTMRKVNYKGSNKLTNPQTSIDIGSAYIRLLLNDWDGNLAMTIASYNAGPNAVKRWLPDTGSIPAVEWIETVPYGETRKYLRSILYAQTVFAWRLGDQTPSLSNKLQSIKRI